ncbi:MAG: flagellar hook-basal body complex protein, partial [Pseudomonadota bacterium]|nr:flagellar hook-basal body complex protein [Pseudomonadota bacterium]
MSLFSTLNTGASGLGVASMGLAVAGDNIANIGTTGYKQTRATFADFMPQDSFGLSGVGKLGSGAATNRLSTLFGQGTVEGSDSSLDMAINGSGFFVVNDGDQSYYSRSGEFFLDNSGYVVSPSGLRLQGYTGTDGALSPAVGDLRVDDSTIPGAATTAVTLDALLSAETEVGSDLAAIDLFGSGAGANTLAEAGAAADFSTSVTVYDSLGVGHEVTVLFERGATSDWSWRAVADASEATDSTGVPFSSEDGYGFEMASGTVTFDTSGQASGFTQTDSTTPWTFAGADPTTLAFDFGIDPAGVASDGAVRMAGSESSVTAISQDGMSTGTLSSLSVDQDGVITGSYPNGEELALGQVVLANFASDSGL